MKTSPIIESYLQAIRKALSSDLIVNFPKQGQHTIPSHDGKCSSALITSWDVSYNQKKQHPELRVYKDGQLLSILKLNENNEWFGRYFYGPGFVVIKGTNVNIWPKLKSLRDFTNHFPVDETLPTFNLIDIPKTAVNLNKYDWDITTQLNDSFPNNPDYAIAIIGCNRPEYFEETIQSIAKNPESKEYPTFVFLDLPENPDERHLQQIQSDFAKKHLPHAAIIKRESTWGCGRNIIDARKQLFDKVRAKRLFVFEDDMPISSTYIRLTQKLFDWATANYDNVGAVQGWNRCSLQREEKVPNLNTVIPCFTNWWGYCMSKEAWDTFSKDMYDYHKFFMATDRYSQRSHSSIRYWFKLKMQQKEERGEKRFPLNDDYETIRYNYMQDPPSGQDAATMHLFDRAGWVRVSTFINRGKYIGEKGIHMNTTMWHRLKYQDLTYHEFDEDKDIDNFSLNITPPDQSDKEFLFHGIVHQED